jgi:peptide deformylase
VRLLLRVDLGTGSTSSAKFRFQAKSGHEVKSPGADRGFAARVFLHENDYVEGMTWLDHVVDNRDIVMEKEYLRQLSG